MEVLPAKAVSYACSLLLCRKKEFPDMLKLEKIFSSKLFAIILAFTILFTTTGLTTLPQEGCPACGCGDIPLDEETYQRYLKPVDPEDRQDTVLPGYYNANALGYVTPAKDQGQCGGCWSFASVGAFESHLIIAGHATDTIDLSEQQQISCNEDQGGCCGGNALALQFWETRGPVYDSCYPFGDGPGTACPGTESNVACSTSCLQLGYRVTNFHTVTVGEANFKASLYDDGPSYFRFDVFQDFMDFYTYASSGAVYTNTGGSKLGGHAVLLIGWDDAKQAFLLKNSWGSTSGPQGDGTFWMAYTGHANNLGFQMANFDVVPTNQAPIANAGTDQEVTPSSTVTMNGSSSYDPDGNDPITYQWEQTAGTTVTLNTSDPAMPTFTAPTAPELLTFSLVVTDSLGLPSAPDSVNIFNGIEPSFELYLPLIMKPGSTGFNSQFNGNADGWEVHSGMWYYDDTSLFTYGNAGNLSTVSYAADFTNLDYKVQLARAGSQLNGNQLFIRGKPDPLSSIGEWYKGYIFQYSANGNYSILKTINGVTSAIKSWTYSSAINQGYYWNTLRITANGGTLKFYINGSLVWSGTDTSLTSGRVGIGMYLASTSTTDWLVVDWATLTTSVSTSVSDLDQISPEQQLLNDAMESNSSGDLYNAPLD